MAWTSYQLSLAVLMVITGSINSLTTKWADYIYSEGKDGKVREFHHPFMQACAMFLGEILCLVVFKIMYFVYKRQGVENEKSLTKGNRNFNPFILFIPAMCDMTATSIMYIGLTMTYVSSFQMFRGSVIIFVGILSIAFLERELKKREWTGIFMVIVGLTTVGIADFLFSAPSANDPDKNSIITGDILIIIAQVITAIQMVVEEKFVTGRDIPPLQAVGWEGLFGFVVLAALQWPFYYIHVGAPFSNNPTGVLEDIVDGFVQIGNNWRLVIAILGTVVSIAFFNFAGISVTKEMSATTRMVLDSVRTIFIWVFSLLFFGQQFIWLQVLGFIALLTGMCLYNGITCRSVIIRLRQLYVRMRYRRMQDEVIINTPADQPDDDPILSI